MGYDKHDTAVRRLRKHGFDDHSLSRWDTTSTIGRETAGKGTDSTLTHLLDEIRQARYAREMGVKTWIQQSLTTCMGRDKHDAVVRRL